MRIVRQAGMLLAVFAVCASVGAMEHDIRRLQARLAEQEARMAEQDARLDDLHARLAGEGGGEFAGSEGIVSLQKNAVVTIGGLVTTKYVYTDAKMDSVYNEDGRFGPVGDRGYKRRADSKTGSMEIGDAELSFRIDVNDHFDAFLNIDLHNGANDDYYNADVYYVRWKDICNSGFGFKVGRDALVFGAEGVGELASYAASGGDGVSETDEAFQIHSGFRDYGVNPYGPGDPMTMGGIVPMHNGWDVSGVTQITPYWEGLDGKLLLELSLIQNVYDDEARVGAPVYFRETASGLRKYRSYNYGVGSMTARATYSPIEDLTFTASFANYRKNGSENEDGAYDDRTYFRKNNTVYGLAFSYRPCFLDRLYLWGQWIHGNNVFFYRGMKSDAVNFGASFDLTERLTYFAQGDYLRTKYNAGGESQTGKAWAFYTGLQYSLPYGVSLEAGWKHERVKYKDSLFNGRRTSKVRANTLYAILGFDF